MTNKSPLKDIANLRQLRDELKLQAHLFKGQCAEDWKKLEKEMKLLVRTQSAPIKDASKKAIESLKQGYAKLKDSLN